MNILTAKAAEHCFGGLIDLARVEPAAGRPKTSHPIVVVPVFDEYG